MEHASKYEYFCEIFLCNTSQNMGSSVQYFVVFLLTIFSAGRPTLHRSVLLSVLWNELKNFNPMAHPTFSAVRFNTKKV
jgi:hypothetical protein